MRTIGAIAIALALLAGVTAVVVLVHPFWSDRESACTQEAKRCPDGSYVGRMGPDCGFAPCPSLQMRRVSLYYYDPQRDADADGNILCSGNGLVAVSRDIPVTETPIADTVRLLLQGDLTDAERSEGIATEYPLSGFRLVGASLSDGVLALSFSDPENRTTGGSCRVRVLRMQVEATALQFPEVEQVVFMPGDVFQP